jgi:integrase
MMAGTDIPVGKSARERPRSLLIDEWPDADRRAWEDACRPRSRLKPGGSASYLADERRVPEWLNGSIDVYLNQSRPVLLRSKSTTNALWISSTTAGPMTTKNLGILVSKVTLETLGVDVSPHLFRTAAASTAAAYGRGTPHLASALLNHTDPRVTEEHYNRASSMNASRIYARITADFWEAEGGPRGNRAPPW